MTKCYDYEWITQDINDSIVVNIVHVSKDDEIEHYNSYQAIDVLEIDGDDVTVGPANINDLTNLLMLGVMRFKSMVSEEILEIPFSSLYKLYDNANVISMETSGVKIVNRLLGIEELNAFAVVNGKLSNEEYKIVATVINELTPSLKKFIELARSYGMMGMNEKFRALRELEMINDKRIQDNKSRI